MPKANFHVFVQISFYFYFYLFSLCVCNIAGSPSDRKISFAVFGNADRSDSIHSSTTTLSQMDLSNSEKGKTLSRRIVWMFMVVYSITVKPVFKGHLYIQEKVSLYNKFLNI